MTMQGSAARNGLAFSAKCLTVAFCVAALAYAAPKKIARAALSPAVEKTVKAQSAGATIKDIASETEDGVFQYEVEMMFNGHTKDIAIAKDGTLLEVEEEVAMNSLPAGVQSALTAKAAGAKITKVESLTKKDKVVAYEAATLKGAKKGEIQVGPNGEKLAHEE
jgi:hypothetical protein